MELVLDGFGILLDPLTFTYLVVGLIAGFVVGVLPGFSSSNAAAILLPFSLVLSAEQALILIAGIYAGAAFAGAVPAILVNVPGTAGTAATALDGYPMTRQGKSDLAIGLARMASVTGGAVSALLVLMIISPMSGFVRQFGSLEMFIIAVMGLTLIGTLVGDRPLKGLVAGFLGMLIAAMSADPQYGQARFDLGFIELYDQVPFVPAMVGLFGITEMVLLSTKDRFANVDLPKYEGEHGLLARIRHTLGQVWEGTLTTLRYPKTLLRSTALGASLGVLPGVGATVASFASYGMARRGSKTPEKFGKGAHEGVISAEAADNAVTSATMVPTLTLGIPGSPTAAIMLAALYLQGIAPGPQLMTNFGAEATAVIWALLIGNLLILPIGIILATPLTYVTKLKPATLAPLVLVLCLVGSYAVRTSFFDVGLALAFGALGLLMRATGYPVVPLVLGLILGPIAESNFVRTVLLSQGEVGYFFGSTTAIVLWCLLAVILGGGFLRAARTRRERIESGTERHASSTTAADSADGEPHDPGSGHR